LREKSISLSAYLRRLIKELLPGGIEIITPEAPGSSGCQVSLRLDPAAFDVRRCHERLAAAGVIADWREPDTLRLAPVPLYNSYHDVFTAVEALREALRP
jgi:kynureninase